MVPTMFVCRSGWVKVKRRMNSIGVMPSSRSSSRTFCHRSHCTPSCLPSVGAPLAAPPRMTIPAPARAAAAMMRLVLALHRRVRDLEDVEHAHRDVVRRGWAACRTCRRSASRPCACSSSTVSRAPSFSRVCRDGEMWNWTTSRWSVRMRARLCSTPSRMLSRVKTCGLVGRAGPAARRPGSRTCSPGSTRSADRRCTGRCAPRSRRSRSRCRCS